MLALAAQLTGCGGSAGNAPIAYRNTFTPTVPDVKLDEEVRWQVAVCTTMSDASGRTPTHAWIVLASRDVPTSW
jgi:hypothetical protein